MSRPARKPRTETPYELTIGEIAPGGDGVAVIEHAGERRAVFVRGAAPGDRLAARVDFRSRPACGQLVELLTPGIERVDPPCPHVVRCGACNWMHLTANAQTRIHEEHVRSALPETWRALPIRVIPAAAELHYRTRARVHVRVSGGRAIVGMHAPQSHDPVEVDACRVLHPAIERARLSLAPLFEGTHGTGEVELALGPLDAHAAQDSESRPFVLAVRWSGALPAETYARFDRAIAAGALRGARIVCGEATRPSNLGDPTPWMMGADGSPLQLAPGGFAQASEAGNLVLARRMGELAHEVTRATQAAGATIVELYAGAGNFTVLLAREPLGVIAVESNGEACQAARANLAARALEAKVVEMDAATYALPKSLHLLVLDPPRTGARAVAEQLVSRSAHLARSARSSRPAQAARFVLYVSCDLATLGRDLRILSQAYVPRTLEAFELFPQTSHLETAILLERHPR
ncbi:MAG TPA: class I SAM-dependent RNA methyltransferase [Polyangiaceae bacterium]|nr:class I SAM-dependent RNA methyltransferase [Polyangiaceae bacterium]